MRVITVGNAIVDYYTDLKEKFPGGSALNVSYYTKIFGAQASSIIGVIGDDKEGQHILNILDEEDVNHSHVRVLEGKTGIVLIKLNENNDRIIGDWQKGVLEGHEFVLTAEDISFIKKHDILHFGLNTNILQYLEEISKNIKVSFDFSTEEDISWFETYGPHLFTTFLSRSQSSLQEIEEVAKYIYEAGVKHVFITRGEKGSTYYNGKNFYNYRINGSQKVIDTLGAGDTFVSYVLTNISSMSTPEKLLKEASSKATDTCTRVGAFGYSI